MLSGIIQGILTNFFSRGTHAADSHSVGDGMLAMVLNELADYLIRRPSTAQQTYAGIQDAYIFCGTDVLPS